MGTVKESDGRHQRQYCGKMVEWFFFYVTENFANGKGESIFFQKKLDQTWLCISLLHLTQEFSLFFIGEYTNNVFHHSSSVLYVITFFFVLVYSPPYCFPKGTLPNSSWFPFLPQQAHSSFLSHVKIGGLKGR